MKHPDYNSPSALKDFLDENGMAMQKKFGQNFLVNSDARKKIIDSLDISNGSTVWEVGPGLGCMSDEILSRGASLTAFEID
ncbi:MAG: 16S rRNA (adenine(1518)-N(6)/adenine(1519)-N(6))-dimethyltransferase, partial [Treponema sp.]|nr:16S rRNA (adenine(1518)-N(6)/adenine(1519)-N(6))-dimethyltransferase [Treponema sp.]